MFLSSTSQRDFVSLTKQTVVSIPSLRHKTKSHKNKKSRKYKKMRLVYSLMLSSMAIQIPGLDEDKQDANNFLRFVQ